MLSSPLLMIGASNPLCVVKALYKFNAAIII